MPALGSVFGEYRLDAELGRGGMGVVYLATELVTQRVVALKVMRDELADGYGFVVDGRHFALPGVCRACGTLTPGG